MSHKYALQHSIVLSHKAAAVTNNEKTFALRAFTVISALMLVVWVVT